MGKNSLDLKVIAGGLLIISALTATAAGIGSCAKRANAIKKAAYEQAMLNHDYNQLIRMGDENGEGIKTVEGVAEMMKVYADINGKQVSVPLEFKKEYLARHNGIPTSGKDGYGVKPETVLEY